VVHHQVREVPHVPAGPNEFEREGFRRIIWIWSGPGWLAPGATLSGSRSLLADITGSARVGRASSTCCRTRQVGR
jgi:hypothetical protein